MRIATPPAVCLLAVSLLAGCLKYEITIVTVIGPEGLTRRTLAIRELSDKPATWKRFQPPADPYTVKGSEKEGFQAQARLRPGRHPTGLRVLTEPYEGDYDGGRGDLAAAEGSLTIEVEDVVIGKLYRYHETVALGLDEARVRAELPRWLDLGLRLLIGTLQRRFPDLELDAVERNAREKILPRLERSLLAVRAALGSLLDEGRAYGYGTRPGPWLESTQAQIILSELARYGLLRKPAVARVETWEEFFAEEDWEKGDVVLAELLAPLPAARREAVKEALLGEDPEMEEASQAAYQAIFPTEAERAKLQKELAAFAVSALGAYASLGFADDFKFHFRVRLPGRVLQTNGSLGRLPDVEWRLDALDLVLRDRQLSAWSFAPVKGVRGSGWSLRALHLLAEALRELDEESRIALDDYVRLAIEGGWPEDPAADLGPARPAYDLMREAVREATVE